MRQRIVWATALVSALAMAAMIVAVVAVLNAVTNHNVRAALDDQLTAVTATLRLGPAGQVRELESPDAAIDSSTWIFDAAGARVVGARTGPQEQATAASLGHTRSRVSIERNDRAYLAAPVRAEGTGRVGAVVVVSTSRQPYESSRAAVVVGLGVLGLLVTAGAAAVAAWTTRRALEPVDSMATLAEDWSEHDLESRFEGSGNDELSHLGHTLNLLLDRVAGAIRREQQLTSELAHELRTPLTAIRGEAELGLIAGPEARLRRVVELTERMNDTVGTLLAVARGHTRTDIRCAASDVLEGVLADLPESGVRTRAEPSALLIAAPLDLAVRALAPLVANAVGHARSEVRLSARAVDRMVEIDVTDDGAGVAGFDPESLFGIGLGLPLSRRLAHNLGGEVLVTSPAAPTVFTLRLHRY